MKYMVIDCHFEKSLKKNLKIFFERERWMCSLPSTETTPLRQLCFMPVLALSPSSNKLRREKHSKQMLNLGIRSGPWETSEAEQENGT